MFSAIFSNLAISNSPHLYISSTYQTCSCLRAFALPLPSARCFPPILPMTSSISSFRFQPNVPACERICPKERPFSRYLITLPYSSVFSSYLGYFFVSLFVFSSPTVECKLCESWEPVCPDHLCTPRAKVSAWPVMAPQYLFVE